MRRRRTILGAWHSTGRRVIRRAAPVFGAVTLACLTVGCESGANTAEYERRLGELRERLAAAERENVTMRSKVAALEQQLRTASGFDERKAQQAYHPVSVSIGALSAGTNLDETPGDDGVKVYVTPVDQYGDALKAAGDLRVEIYDLAREEGSQRIGVCTFDATEAAQLWYGQLLTYHYTLECPWERQPRSDTVTVRVTFVDYLTRRAITAQRAIRVAPRREVR